MIAALKLVIINKYDLSSGNGSSTKPSHSISLIFWKDVQTTQGNIEKQSRKTQENIRDSIDECSQLESRLEAESNKYTFLQQLKGYIADLCDMLQVGVTFLPTRRDHFAPVSPSFGPTQSLAAHQI